MSELFGTLSTPVFKLADFRLALSHLTCKSCDGQHLSSQKIDIKYAICALCTKTLQRKEVGKLRTPKQQYGYQKA
jgi:predicted amidophosphoribosyltransferase